MRSAMVRLALSAAGLGLVVAGCGDSRRVDAGDAPVGAATTAGQEGTDASWTILIDTEAILARYGFERCDGVASAGDVTADRGQEILSAAVDAGIAQGGSPGGEGFKAVIFLFVLDDSSLASLAGIAQPTEACVTGQDPIDYVAPGPQELEGPGWRWVGAGLGAPIAAWPRSTAMPPGPRSSTWPCAGTRGTGR